MIILIYLIIYIMVKYESLLLGGKMRSKKAESESESESEEEEMLEKKVKGGKMTYEDRCRNLAKGRATRAKNLLKKKEMEGKGFYTQDYVDESQINYAGSPLDMYYREPKKQAEAQRRKKGEMGKGLGDMEAMEQLTSGGKVKKDKKVKSDDMRFMEQSLHTGMDMPTEAQFKRGGKMKKAVVKKAEVKKPEEYEMDITGAIQNLAMLASKFGLRLVK